MFGRKHETGDDRHTAADDERTHGDTHGDTRRDTAPADRAAVSDRGLAHDRYGGVNVGAAFFGWLVAIAMTVLLTGIIGAIAAAISRESEVTLGDADASAGEVGLTAAIVLAVVLMLAYYTGGYVAGRMSRFDGASQGFAVWLIGLVVTILAGVLGWIFGDEYNVLERVDLPNVPFSADELSTAGIITAVVLLALTALAAIGGGKVGSNYHRKVDAAHLR